MQSTAAPIVTTAPATPTPWNDTPRARAADALRFAAVARVRAARAGMDCDRQARGLAISTAIRLVLAAGRLIGEAAPLP